MSADDEATASGRILREISLLRNDVHSMRVQADTRHLTVANEMAELRATAQRAIETAIEAKRISDTSVYEIRSTQHSLIQHTQGLSMRQQAVENAVELVRKENHAQTASLDTLVEAENVRKIQDDHRVKQDDARWKWIGRVWPIATAIVALAAWAAGHWKP